MMQVTSPHVTVFYSEEIYLNVYRLANGSGKSGKKSINFDKIRKFYI